ncbi:MAG: oligosaccharide flippase family protein [Aquabacterium sp.]|nr:oligosaccharide flippase family protein [Aquabacterium sp.]
MNNLLHKILSVRKNNFFAHSKNYLLAEIFNKGLVFFTIPIFTRLLSPEEYGILAIFTSIIAIFTVVMGLNFQASIVVKYSNHDKDFSEFLGANLIYLFLNNIILISACSIFVSPLASFFSISNDIFIIAVIISSFVFFLQVELAYLQASQQSKKYANISVVRNLLITLLALVWTYLLKNNKYYGNVYSQLLVFGIIFIFVVFSLIKVARFCFELKHLKYALLFSIPLIPHTLAGIVLSQVDRLMINHFLGSSQVGLYFLAFNVGLLVAVFIGALNNAWIPIFFDALKNGYYDKIQNLAEKYSKIVFIAAFCLILFSKEIIIIMADKQYSDSYKIVPLFALSGVATFLYTLFVNYAFYKRRTGLISIISLVSCLINIILNYILIPRYGYAGAAWANLFSHILLFILHYSNVRFILKLKVIRLDKIIVDIVVLFICIGVYAIFRFDALFFDFLLKMLLVLVISIFYLKDDLLTPRTES